MRVLIIEDEPLAQAELARILKEQFSDMKIVGTLATVDDSIEWLNSHEADLIFMDIQLADGNSFEIFDEVEVHTPIIFTTAYDKYAIQAFQVNSIGYLLKPIVEEELVAAVNKLDFSSQKLSALLDTVRPQKGYKSRIIIKLGDKIDFIQMQDVAYFYAEDKITYMVPKKGRKQIVDYTIADLEPLLDPKQFFRLTRGCLASIDSITKVSKFFNSRLMVKLQPEYEGELLVSRARVARFLQWLDGE